jgi:hypothetical protein
MVHVGQVEELSNRRIPVLSRFHTFPVGLRRVGTIRKIENQVRTGIGSTIVPPVIGLVPVLLCKNLCIKAK